MRNRNTLIFLIWIVVLQGCYLDTNTTDPQSSPNIENSIKNDLFINEYKMGSTDNPKFQVKSAWVEECWKYKQSIFLRPSKQKTGCYQLNLIINNLDSIFRNDYGQKWDLKVESYGYFRNSADSIYSLSYYPSHLPDSFDIIVEQYGKDFTKIPFAHFTVLKK